MRPGRGATSTTLSPCARSYQSHRSQIAVEVIGSAPTGAHSVILINPELPRYRSWHGASTRRGGSHVEFGCYKFSSEILMRKRVLFKGTLGFLTQPSAALTRIRELRFATGYQFAEALPLKKRPS